VIKFGISRISWAMWYWFMRAPAIVLKSYNDQ